MSTCGIVILTANSTIGFEKVLGIIGLGKSSIWFASPKDTSAFFVGSTPRISKLLDSPVEFA